jgi:3-oxoadipate enol-lactonase
LKIHWRRAGAGPSVVLVHAVACDLGLWDAQAHALALRHDVMRYDVRGHGKSELPAPSFTFDDLADDLDRLLGELDIPRSHIVGLSMGGVIARLLALRHPQRVESLVLCSTMASLPPGAAAAWSERARLVRDHGIAAIVEPSLAHWFAPGALAVRAPAVERIRGMLQTASPDAYLAVCAAVPQLDFFQRQHAIRVPALVLAGAADPHLATLDPEALARAIPGATLRILAGAGHFPNLEVPDAFDRAVLEFLASGR